MKLGLFLAIGESLEDFNSKGQLKRLVNYNIKKYSKSFEKVYIFSYGQRKFDLPANCTLITNNFKLHRYIYSLLLPVINFKYVKQCDVIRGLQLTGGIPAAVSKILFQKRFVINFGYDYMQFAQIEKKYLQSFFYNIIQSPILKLADSIIVTSKTTLKTIGKKYRNKTVYIPNGVDTKLFHPLKKSETKKLSLVFIGRLEPQKNLHSLLKALSFLEDPFITTFFGEGSERKNLISQAKKLRLPLKIEKPVDYEKVAKILRESDVFALPSLNEGSPKILLEAMASGCAIVASDIYQIAEIVENNKSALLCNPDPKSLAEEINVLKNFKKRQNLGLNARRSAVRNYEINKLLNKEINILKSLHEKQ